jgi:serine/threonine protein kinase
MPQDIRDQVFVSYSHTDEHWRKRFQDKLAPLERTQNLVLWSDERIKPGINWLQSIEEAIARSKAALILVSDAFLNSPFIQNHELPKILDRHHKRGLYIYWVPIDHTLAESNQLSKYQAAYPRPLIELEQDPAARDSAIAEVCKNIVAQLGQYSSLDRSARECFQQEVTDSLREQDKRIIVEREIAGGDFSIVYRAQQDDLPIAVKAIVGSPLQTWAIDMFDERVKKARDFRNQGFIRILGVFLKSDPHSVLMELIEAPTLAQVLERNGPLDGRRVTSIMIQLADALAEAHKAGLAYGNLRPSSIFIFEDNKIRFSAVDLSNELMRSEQLRGNVVLPHELPTYIIPEQYYCSPWTERSDQYSLALLALEMLSGHPPVPVRKPEDLERKREFFENPGQAFAEWAWSAPQLARVLRRMLSKAPAARYSSMDEVSQILTRIKLSPVAEDDPELARAKAKQSYQHLRQENPKFYESFYQEFFQRSPESEPLFKNVNLEQQYRMLDMAIQQMLNFRQEEPEPTTISWTVQSHQKKLKLTREQVEKFFAAFLQTLEAGGQTDEETLQAWRITLLPGIEYMLSHMAQG